MTDWLFNLILAWHVALILLLLGYALQTRNLIGRIVAFDAVTIVFVAGLSVIAIERQEPYYLDIALVMAMLGFVQTVAAVRLVEQRRNSE